MEEQHQHSQSEETTQEQQEREPAHVLVLVQWMIDELQAQAWVNMGLWKEPITGELRTDLSQAKIAVDCVAALAEVVKPHLPDDQRRDLDRLLTDLRLNFVQRSAEAPRS